MFYRSSRSRFWTELETAFHLLGNFGAAGPEDALASDLSLGFLAVLLRHDGYLMSFPVNG
jgi:hypothetical protein